MSDLLPPKNDGCCKRIRTAIKLFTRRDAPKIERHLFIHSLPIPLPTEKNDILDLIAQIILLLLEQFKPPDNGDNNNGDTAFPELARQAHNLAKIRVPPPTLKNTAHILATTIIQTINDLLANPPQTFRLARERIRQANHHTLGAEAAPWTTWNAEIRDILDAHADNNKLRDLTDYFDAWTQIAKGLKNIT